MNTNKRRYRELDWAATPPPADNPEKNQGQDPVAVPPPEAPAGKEPKKKTAKKK